MILILVVLRAALAIALIGGCSGVIGGDDDPNPNDSGVPDSGMDDAGYLGECGETGEAILFFENRCTNSACHAGRQFPLLTREGLADLSTLESEAVPGRRLVVPGDPESSWLYIKMSDMQGDEGAMMPLGVSTPVAELPLIESWIRDGARTECDDLPPPILPTDPNTLDPGVLFTCDDPGATRSSPGRLRRIERQELTHAAVRSLNGTWWGSTMKDNPFDVGGLPYSTYTRGLSVDPATLDLYMLNLPEAASLWSARDPVSVSPPATRTRGLYDADRDDRCIFEDADPAAECLDWWVDMILTRGVLFREPTSGERSRLRAFLAESLAAETDFAERRDTLHHVAQGAFLMSGTLFRNELPGGDSGPMSNDDLGLALGHVLSTRPVGSLIPISEPLPEDPDVANPDLGRLGLIRQAVEDGTIQDAEVRRNLLRTYGSGVAFSRPDIASDTDDRELATRGQYWLAPGFMRFFREFFDYENANTVFKDTPGATSNFDGASRTTEGYTNNQHGYYGHELRFVDQLDDTIARAVVESEMTGADVFRTLMTTRMYRLPSTTVNTNGVSCTSESDCGGDYASCTAIGLCGSSISGSTATAARVYEVDVVPNTPEGRWVTLPDDQRAGVLTHPVWLTAHGANFEDDASLVHRGKWIREYLFCETVPPLELVMVEAQLVESAPELSARVRVQRSIEENPDGATCMGCHAKMNTLGLPFEVYNHAGYLRGEDHGSPPDGSTTVDNLPDPALNRSYSDPIEFVEALADSDYARRSFVRHAFRYFMGRAETLADGCTLVEMENALDSTGSFFAMIEALVSSETFSHREGAMP